MVTLAHDITSRAERHGERIAVSFTVGDGIFTEMSYAELGGRAAAFGALLRAVRRHQQEPQFVLIILPNGLEYVTSFYGCLIGGAVAVPFYPPGALNARTAAAFRDRLNQIMRDCRPSVIVLPANLAEHVRAELAASDLLGGTVLIAAEDLPDATTPGDGVVHARPGDLALLQYTSGSTTVPRGVMVSHDNLVHNASAMGARLGSADGESMVTWLPLYHDMGLVGSICHPLLAGMTVQLTTPSAFVRRPVLWLRMTTQFRPVIIAAPNFAYDLCVGAVSEEQRAGLDLRSVRFAVSAAEPVRRSTLAAFIDAYQPYGFDPSAFAPGYGLAEATLAVSLCGHGRPSALLEVSADELRHGTIAAPAAGEAVTALVGCGTEVDSDTEVVIVDRTALVPLKDRAIGEIWATGPSVAQGYWGLPDLSAQEFAAELPGDGRRFLRTGDLGVKVDGSVYVTGRVKDVIIQRGINHYPQDVEFTAEKAHPAMRPGGSAVFTVPSDDGEQVVLLCELTRYGDPATSSQILHAVRIAIAEQHGLDVPVAAIVRKGQIPKTTSGKVRRRNSAKRWLDNDFDTVAVWPERRNKRADTTPVSAAAAAR
jgi:acyl-CoA synthetase (AMP-forming)/AMP-acid ligase II